MAKQKLTLAQIEHLLFKARDILRGKREASEYKEFLFGMMLLRRLTDQFWHNRTAMQTESKTNGMKPAIFHKQFDYMAKYTFTSSLTPAETNSGISKHRSVRSQQNLDTSLVRAIEMPEPGPLKQTRIAKILDTLIQCIDAEHSVLAKLKEQKTGLMKDLLTGKVRVMVDKAEKESIYA